jgi:hypothetical protein
LRRDQAAASASSEGYRWCSRIGAVAAACPIGSIFLKFSHYRRTGLNQSARMSDEVTRVTSNLSEIITIDGPY